MMNLLSKEFAKKIDFRVEKTAFLHFVSNISRLLAYSARQTFLSSD